MKRPQRNPSKEEIVTVRNALIKASSLKEKVFFPHASLYYTTPGYVRAYWKQISAEPCPGIQFLRGIIKQLSKNTRRVNNLSMHPGLTNLVKMYGIDTEELRKTAYLLELEEEVRDARSRIEYLETHMKLRFELQETIRKDDPEFFLRHPEIQQFD
jgi:hypothetical protein